MKRKKIIAFRHENDGLPRESAIYKEDVKWYGGKPLRRAPTLDEIIQLLDDDAENDNRHDFVGCHGPLAYIMQQNGFGVNTVYAVMNEIAELGGLAEMARGCNG